MNKQSIHIKYTYAPSGAYIHINYTNTHLIPRKIYKSIADSFFLKINSFNSICLFMAVLGLSCSTRASLQLWYVSSRACGLCSCGAQTQLTSGMWDPSSRTRDQTHVPCIGRWIPNHWIPREVPADSFMCCVEFLTSCGSDPVSTITKALLGVGFLLEWDPFILIIYSDIRPLPKEIMELF